MKKYWTVFLLSFQNEFTYRLNFILWRVRNVLRILMTYFLWNSVFSQNKIAFGYTHEQVMAYVFLVLIVNTIVMSAPSNDNIGGEISNGDLGNFLLKPISYLRYWLTRDWASKLLNILFAVGEVSLLYIIFIPKLFFSSSPAILLLSILSVIIASLIYFLITKLAVLFAFWTPENTWGLMFIFLVLYELLSGGIFPLDVLPNTLLKALEFTPFPYLVYYPIVIAVGKVDLVTSFSIVVKGLFWIAGLSLLVKKMWHRGLKIYSVSGR